MNSRTPDKEEKAWMQEARQIGCIVCVLFCDVPPWTTPEEYTAIHHIDGSTKPGAHLLTIPLCAAHHQTGPNARHKNKTRFTENFGGEDYLRLMTKDFINTKDR
jgi:hypothetical protein